MSLSLTIKKKKSLNIIIYLWNKFLYYKKKKKNLYRLDFKLSKFVINFQNFSKKKKVPNYY